MIGIFRPISVLKQHFTNLKQTYILRPLFSYIVQPMDSKRQGFCISLAFFHKNYTADAWLIKTIATVVELSEFWKPWAMVQVSPFVMTWSRFECSCLCQLFHFYCLQVQSLCCLLKNFFFFSFHDVEEEVKPQQLWFYISSAQTMSNENSSDRKS